jgi:molybdopterin/thiamine biosynthesis adenylyltransferase
MALAPFFDKAALAASHILRGFDYVTFAETLNKHIVGVAFDEAAAISFEGPKTLHLSINLLARLYPRLAIVGLGENTSEPQSDLAELAQAINPNIEIVTSLSDVCVCLVVGETRIDTSARLVYIGSTGWLVRVSAHNPVGSGDTDNPFGAGAAACFGAANIFRMLFGASLPLGQPDDDFVLSLLDYQTNHSKLANPPLTPINIGETHLVGIGAIGNGTVWALARLPDIQGTLHLVDDESIDISNLQRYVLTKITNEKTLKVSLAAEFLNSTKLSVRPHEQRWGEYLAERSNWNIERVAVAVDSDMDRCVIQASLPRRIVNAWTQPGDLGVSRHDFLNKACLMCLYLPNEEQKSDDLLVAEAIRLPEAQGEVRELLYTGKPIGIDFVTRIANAYNIPANQLLQFAEQPLRQFYSKAICGGIVLSLGGDYRNASQAEVPMAFQSALAGIMLAAEIVVDAGGFRPAPLPTMTKSDLLRPLGNDLSIPAAKHPSGQCICQDSDYISVYQNKYPDAIESNQVID